MADLFPPTTEEMIAELKRELRYRDRVYPKQIAKKFLAKDTAERRLQIMEALIQRLERELSS